MLLMKETSLSESGTEHLNSIRISCGVLHYWATYVCHVYTVNTIHICYTNNVEGV